MRVSTMQDSNERIQRIRPFLDIAARRLAKHAQGDEEKETVEETARPQGSPPPEDEQTAGHEDDKGATPGGGIVEDVPTGPTDGPHGVARPETGPTKKSVEGFEREYHIAKSDEAKRYTLGPLYVPDYIDAHGDFTTPDVIEQATWDYVRAGNREINLEHTTKRAGEYVGLLTWPFPVEVEMQLPGSTVQKTKKIKFPAGTPFMGVIWDEWAWNDLVVPGLVKGFSIEGWGTRVRLKPE